MQRWIELARQFIGLHEVKGREHNPEILQMWKDIKRGGIKDDETPWCFTGDTQILTENGFIRFDQLGNERVYQADERGILSLTHPERVQKNYTGDVFDISHRSINLTCDAGHRWWGRWGKSMVPHFGTLEDISADGLYIDRVFTGKEDGPWTDAQLELIAAFISDGKYRYSNGKNDGHPWSIDFEVSKERKVERLGGLGPDHVYTQSKVYGPLTKKPLTVFRFNYPAWFDDVFIEYKSLSPSFIASLSRRQALLFMRFYSVFDGDAKEAPSIYTADRIVLNDLLWIATVAGLHVAVQTRAAAGLSQKESFVISYSETKDSRHIRRKHVSRREFKGEMYCVRVPHGRIVVKGENSAPVVTGNCAAFVGAMLERAGIQSSRFEGARSYASWGEKLAEPTDGCVVVFSRDGGGHVGFVVGQDSVGNLLVLGGNQSDAVNVKAFPRSRVTAYRWPAGVSMPIGTLPVRAPAEFSKSEA